VRILDPKGGESKEIPSEKLIFLTPPKRSPSTYSRCDVVIAVTRDFKRVFIGGGETGYDGLGREADTLEIKALAERFDFAELRKARDRRTKWWPLR